MDVGTVGEAGVGLVGGECLSACTKANALVGPGSEGGDWCMGKPAGWKGAAAVLRGCDDRGGEGAGVLE